jgi:Raf kinase inhibitor-like YbhB/YbcL family protein
VELRSSAFTSNTPIPARFSRDGENVSLPLEWSGVPNEAVELALICEDPDAPRGTFVHWLVGRIAPMDAAVGAGQTPEGSVVGRNDFGNTGWDGPQPPPGAAHRYYFRLYALNAPANLRTRIRRGPTSPGGRVKRGRQRDPRRALPAVSRGME